MSSYGCVNDQSTAFICTEFKVSQTTDSVSRCFVAQMMPLRFQIGYQGRRFHYEFRYIMMPRQDLPGPKLAILLCNRYEHLTGLRVFIPLFRMPDLHHLGFSDRWHWYGCLGERWLLGFCTVVFQPAMDHV